MIFVLFFRSSSGKWHRPTDYCRSTEPLHVSSSSRKVTPHRNTRCPPMEAIPTLKRCGTPDCLMPPYTVGRSGFCPKCAQKREGMQRALQQAEQVDGGSARLHPRGATTASRFEQQLSHTYRTAAAAPTASDGIRRHRSEYHPSPPGGHTSPGPEARRHYGSSRSSSSYRHAPRSSSLGRSLDGTAVDDQRSSSSASPIRRSTSMGRSGGYPTGSLMPRVGEGRRPGESPRRGGGGFGVGGGRSLPSSRLNGRPASAQLHKTYSPIRKPSPRVMSADGGGSRVTFAAALATCKSKVRRRALHGDN